MAWRQITDAVHKETIHTLREREKDVKCKRSRRTGRSGGISRIAAKNWKLLCGVEEVRGNPEFKQNETKFPQSI